MEKQAPSRFPLSPKYLAFMRHKADNEFLEGTTSAGKTTVGLVKFIFKVRASERTDHIIAASDLGVAEKNLINADMGILDVFGQEVRYFANGNGSIKMAHLRLGDKVIYVLGYGDKKRWEKALGGQYGCVYIDEVNTATIDFVQEAMMRCDYAMFTLNPDNPALPVYEEYINHSRPLPEWSEDIPAELLKMLDRPEKPGWTWWYFTFDDNAALTPEKRARIIDGVAVGTKRYKNKILGLRGRATGLVFNNFDRARHVVRAKDLLEDKEKWAVFTSGLDTAYSSKSDDVIAMSFIGITTKGRAIVLDVAEYNNKGRDVPLAPSDTVKLYIAFLDKNKDQWGLARHAFIDSADQATITEFKKYVSKNGSFYNFTPAYKRMKVIDRIYLQLGWFAHEQFAVLEGCTPLIEELEAYSWREDKDNEPEDKNDHHINAQQYAWLPYVSKIGVKRGNNDRVAARADA